MSNDFVVSPSGHYMGQMAFNHGSSRVILHLSMAKGGGVKLPPPISPVPSHIETKFQRLPPYFRLCPTQLCHRRHSPTPGTSGIQDGGWKTGKTPDLWNGMIYQRNFSGKPHIFDKAQLAGDNADIGRHPELQNNFHFRFSLPVFGRHFQFRI